MHERRKKVLALAEPQRWEAVMDYVDESVEKSAKEVGEECESRVKLVLDIVKVISTEMTNIKSSIANETTIIKGSITASNDTMLNAIKALSDKQDDHISSLAVTVALERAGKTSFSFGQKAGALLGRLYTWTKNVCLGLGAAALIIFFVMGHFTKQEIVAYVSKLLGV